MKKKIIVFFIINIILTKYLIISKSNSQMKIIKTEFFTLHYENDLKIDIEIINSFFNHAVKAMLVEFNKYNPENLLKTANCNAYLYTKINDKVTKSRPYYINCGTDNNKYYANIYFLTSFAYNPSSYTSLGEPLDENYFFRMVVHEYSTIILERLTKTKTQGWTFFNAPNWFIQGYEEYLGLICSSDYTKKKILPKYLKKMYEPGYKVYFTSEIKAKKPYIQGAILLTFMHDTYGKEKVHSILLSEKSFFYEAMWDVLDDDLAGFASKFKKWKDQKKKTLTE